MGSRWPGSARVHTPWRLLGAAVILAGWLVVMGQNAVPAMVAPAEAPHHEGETVRLAGVVREARPWGDGQRIVLAHEGHAIAAVGPVAPVALGTWMEATGRLVRFDGELVLQANGFSSASGPSPAHPAWATLSLEPAAWQDHLVRLEGRVADGWLEGDGARLRLGQGDWPADGHVDAVGIIAYEAACMCHVLHAGTVRPWTS